MLTVNEIKQFIGEDAASTKKLDAAVGQRYYEGEHDILNYRLFYYNTDGVLTEDKTRTNIKIPHPFFTELVDQLAAYITSFENNPIRAKNPENGLQAHLDKYFDESFWAEMQDVIAGCNAKGFEYLYGYKNADERLSFQCADSLGVVEIREQDSSDKQPYYIWHYADRVGKDRKRIRRIQVHSKDEIWFFVQDENYDVKLDTEREANPIPNVIWEDKKGDLYGYGLGFIPFWRLDNNQKQISGLKPIKALIDDYDLMECGLSNNLQDFDTPIHVVSGFQGDNLDELQQNLKTKKIIGVDAEGSLDIKTIDVPYEARKTKADEDEKNIYRFGMGFNSSQVGDGNITNVVIRSRYTLLDLKAKKLENRIKAFLKQGVIRVVLDEINAANKTDYRVDDVEIIFEHIINTNETENAQNDLVKAQTEQVRIGTILSAAAVIGDDEVLKAICDVLDLDYEDVKAAMDKLNPATSLGDAQNLLDGVVTEDEQPSETGSAVVS